MKTVRSSFGINRELMNEGEKISHTIALDTDTTGKTLTALIYDDGITTLGTASGDSAETDIEISLDTDGLDPGEYVYEVWVDYGESTQAMVFPLKNVSEYTLEVINRVGIS